MNTTNLIIISVTLLLMGCSTEPRNIVDAQTEKYLNENNVKAKNEALLAQQVFWNAKLQSAPDNSVYLKKVAALHAKDFDNNFNVLALHTSDSIYKSLHEKYPNDVGVLHALVQNSITQHAFNDGLMYCEKAIAIGEKKFISSLFKVDLLLEKGALNEARFLLSGLDNQNCFDVQIRKVKILDAEGKLDEAVSTMEGALANATASNRKDLMVWAYGNLGDMYGHQGKVNESYASYLKALDLDAADTHSLKGIGWIAYSNDRDYEKAGRIWNHLATVSNNPELKILLAELNEMKGNSTRAAELELAFVNQVSQHVYGNMYGSYLVDLLAEEQPERSLQIATADVKQRKHPVTFAKLAWAYFNSNDVQEATRIVQDHVLEKTEEPDALLKAGIILSKGEYRLQGIQLLEESQDAAFELGPLAEKEINQSLATL